jgi:hemoglobin
MTTKCGIVLLVLCLGGQAQAATLYDDLGGRKQIAGFTDDLVERAIHDDRIKHFFKETDIPRLKGKITDQICHLSGEKKSYRGANMKNAHSDFPIHVADFNALVEDLQLAMDDSDIPFTTQNRLLALLAPMERDIVNQ